jgi:hypothetical protein
VLATAVPQRALNAGPPAGPAPEPGAVVETDADPQTAAEQRNRRSRQSPLVFRNGSLYVRENAPDELAGDLKGSAADER